jgi:shikimate kinase
MERIRELLEQRAPYYARADYTIETSERSVAGIASEIAQIFAGKSFEKNRGGDFEDETF